MANQYKNKIVYNGTILLDLSGDTVTLPEHIMAGFVGHLSDGRQVTGTGQGGGSASTIPLTASGVFTLSANAQTMQIPHGLGQIPTMACFYPADSVTNSAGTNITIGGTFGKIKTDGSNVFPPSVSVSSGWSADRIPNRAGLYCSPDGNVLDDAQMVWQYDDDDWGIIDVDATYIYIKAGYSNNPLLWTGTRYKWWAIAPTDTGGSGGGGSATLITKTITANGTYSASDDSADGYSSVTVNVPTGGGSSPTYENIVPLQTLNCNIGLNNGAYGAYINPYLEFPVEGEKYRVTFDGTEYTVKAQKYGSTSIYIGDIGVEASAADATLTYPFEIILYNGEAFYLAVKGSGSHTLQVDKITSEGSGGGDTSSNPLKGKIATFTGDSICAGAGYLGGYAGIIGDDYDMIIENIGVSDGTVVNWQNKFCISESIEDMRSDADFVILEGGGNDADWGPQFIPVGTLTSGYDATLDRTTFAGAFEYMLKSAITKFPSAKIGYIFIHKCIANFDAPSGAYHTMAISALEKWGIPYCDLNVMIPPLGYVDALKSAYTMGDGIHPNEAGYRTFYAPKIVAFMQTMLTDKSLTDKTITANGTYSAEDDDADGYSEVTVNVPQPSAQTKTGTVTGGGTITLDIPCDFEPDLIYVYGDMSASANNRGVVSITILKDTFAYMSNDSSTSNTNENFIYGEHGASGYGDSSQITVTHSNGTLTLNTVTNSSARRFCSGQTYNYTLIKWT